MKRLVRARSNAPGTRRVAGALVCALFAMALVAIDEIVAPAPAHAMTQILGLHMDDSACCTAVAYAGSDATASPTGVPSGQFHKPGITRGGYSIEFKGHGYSGSMSAQPDKFTLLAYVKTKANESTANRTVVGMNNNPRLFVDTSTHLAHATLYAYDPIDQNHPTHTFNLAGGKVSDGSWHQVGATFDGEQATLFVDGYVVDTETADQFTKPSYSGSPGYYIGNTNQQSDFRGYIDEVGGWDDAFTPEDIATNYNIAVNLREPSERLGCCNAGENAHVYATAGHPVDLYTGNWYDNFVDLQVPGRGLAFSWSRSYNAVQAVAAVESPFGLGWTGSYGMHVVADSDMGAGAGGYMVYQENDAAVPFYLNSSGGYTGPPRVLGTLAKTDSNTTLTYTRRGREKLKFSIAGATSGKLLELRDLSDNVTSLSYDSNGYLTGVTDPAGRSYSVAWNSTTPKHISSVTDPIGRTVSYGYNDSGSVSHLTDVTDVRGQNTHFTYDSSHRVTEIRDGEGVTILKNHYDSNGRVDYQEDAFGYDHRMTFAYSVDVDAPTVPSTIVTDRNANQTKYEMGVAGLTTKMTSAYGCSCSDTATWTYSLDSETLGVNVVTDPEGHTASIGYDPTTHLPSLTAREGITGQASVSYDTSTLLPTSAVDFNQTTTTYSYVSGGDGILASVSTPVIGDETATVTYNHGDSGHPDDVTSITDPRGNTWTTHHQSDGMVDYTIDPTSAANKTTFGMDLVDRPVWSVSPLGNVSGGTPADYRSVSVTDPSGRVLLAANPLGHGVVDQFGRANSTTTLGTTNTGETWTASSGATWGVSAGAAYLVSGSNATATVPVSSADGILVFSAPAPQDGTGVTFRFQDASNYWKVTADTTNDYWAVARVASGSTAQSGNTGAGTCCDPGDVVSVIMNGTSVKVAVNGIVKASFTSSSLISEQDVGLWATSAGTAATAGSVGAGRTAPIGWSALDGFAAAAYDKNGRVITSTDANLKVTANTYDDAGRLITITRGDGSTLENTYDYQGNLLKQKDSRSGTKAETEYHYDHQNRVDWTDDPLDRRTSYTYYGNGLVHTRVSNKPTTSGTYTVTYSYDDANRLTTIDYDSAGPTTHDVVYEYDDNGNRLSMEDDTGTSTYTYDLLNRVIGYTNGHGEAMAWDYDANSNITTVTYPGTNHDVTRHFDAANQMDWMTDWTSSTHITFGYDADGHLTSQSRPNSTTATYTYDKAGAPDDIKWEKTGTPNTTLGEWAYDRDPMSQVSGITSTNVGVNKTYEYNSLEQLSKAGSTNYTYDSADNPTSIGTGTISGYDIANQYTTRTTTNTVTYGWDNDGNRNSYQLNSGTPYTFTFDQENRQTAMSSTSTYEYNGDGLRMETNVWTAVTNFTWDITTAAAQLTVAGNDNYLYGPGGRLIEIINTSNSKQTWLSEDQYNSTRILTDNSGNKCGDYTYDPWGNISTHGTTTNCTNAVTGTAMQWNSQYKDGDTGYYYLRHRLYDPNTGGFTSRDPVNASTRSAYGYVYNNPLNASDPSGLCNQGGASGAIYGFFTGDQEPCPEPVPTPPGPPTQAPATYRSIESILEELNGCDFSGMSGAQLIAQVQPLLAQVSTAAADDYFNTHKPQFAPEVCLFLCLGWNFSTGEGHWGLGLVGSVSLVTWAARNQSGSSVCVGLKAVDFCYQGGSWNVSVSAGIGLSLFAWRSG